MNRRRMKEYLGIALIATQMAHQRYEYEEMEEPKPKRVVVPAGAKYYHFRADGTFETNEGAPEWSVFSCIARTDRAAIKKFKKQQ